MRRHHFDALFLIQIYLGSELCPTVLETVVSETLIRASETLLHSMSLPQVKIVPLLHALRRPMLFAETSKYVFGIILFFLIIFL
jgi:hypothetical protein